MITLASTRGDINPEIKLYLTTELINKMGQFPRKLPHG